MAMSWHQRKPSKGMLMSDIKSIEDHGLFYIDPGNLKYAKWLTDNSTTESAALDFTGNLSDIDPVVVDITPPGNLCELKVMRVISEKLIPINFGYGSEHYGHSRMNVIKCAQPLVPHFFA